MNHASGGSRHDAVVGALGRPGRTKADGRESLDEFYCCNDGASLRDGTMARGGIAILARGICGLRSANNGDGC